MKATMTPRASSGSLRNVMLQRKCACGGKSGRSGECEACRKKRLERQTGNQQTAIENESLVPPIVHEVLRAAGQPLDPTTRAFMEPRFGHDFGHVRVHTDARAAESARTVNALAYTVGQDIVFDGKQYAPQSNAGRRLIAHELAHTLQQRFASAERGPLRTTKPGDRWEADADRATEALFGNESFSVTTGAGLVIARQTPKGPSPYTSEELEEKRRLEEKFKKARSKERGRYPEAIHTWGWGGPETDNIYQECNIEPMDRQTFRSFLKTLPTKPRRNKPKDADDVMGVTHFDPNQAVPPEIAAVPVQDGKKTVFKLKPTHAEMPPILSAYTKIETDPKEFVEGSLPYAKQECNDYWKSLHRPPKGRYDIIWQLPDDGAEKFKEAEAEHCQDIRLAFDLTLVQFASVLNNLAATERTYSTEKQVIDEATRRVGMTPDQMLLEFYRAAIRTETRDNSDWHTAKCVTKDHCQDPDPNKNLCRGYIRRLDAAALPEVGSKHPSEQVVIVQQPTTGGKK